MENTMKTALAVLALTLMSTYAFSTAFAKDVHVKGYTKQDGTYVQPHHRSTPDSSNQNNYSSEGGYNPYTGKSGGNDYTYQAPKPKQNNNGNGLNWNN